jgi:hypothetical protein
VNKRCRRIPITKAKNEALNMSVISSTSVLGKNNLRMAGAARIVAIIRYFLLLEHMYIDNINILIRDRSRTSLVWAPLLKKGAIIKKKTRDNSKPK